MRMKIEERMTEITNPDMSKALQLALDASPEFLAELTSLSPDVRNSKEVFDTLGHVTGAKMAYAMQYIVDRVWAKEPVSVHAVYALSLFNNPQAESKIIDLAAIALDDRTHPEHTTIGPAAMKALEKMETGTAADKILELGKKYDVLARHAMDSLGNLYAKDGQTFGSAYRRMMGYATSDEVMDRLISVEWDNGEQHGLSNAFIRADDLKILGTIPRGFENDLQAAWMLADSSRICSELYKLALKQRYQRAELQDTAAARNALLAIRQLG
jgi:hypothetical protein